MKKVLMFMLAICMAFMVVSCKNNVDTPKINIPEFTGIRVASTASVQQTSFKKMSLDAAPLSATVGDDIILDILLDNPDEYEIISLKINGIKYVGNYQEFEKGSSAECIKVKVNVGTEVGEKTYTVSDIKWINETAIEYNALMRTTASDSITVTVNPVPLREPALGALWDYSENAFGWNLIVFDNNPPISVEIILYYGEDAYPIDLENWDYMKDEGTMHWYIVSKPTSYEVTVVWTDGMQERTYHVNPIVE